MTIEIELDDHIYEILQNICTDLDVTLSEYINASLTDTFEE